ncbi:MAG: LysM peptidoglycan-binding domain-containing protein [Spirochaetaceae bacterium]|jgi:membrane-bound lytic murein transglycosylase D|nr:LysM peptidoglycan-binding domain-containing protein [Spirochaetaceae bacterium]
MMKSKAQRAGLSGLFFRVLFTAALVLPLGASSEPETSGLTAPSFERPLRQNRAPLPAGISRQQQDRLRFPVIPAIYGLDYPLTQTYIHRYSAPSGLKWISSVMKNAEPYLSFIRNELELRGLPPELLYLPVVESGYTGTARSPSGAAGLWQFMRNSIRPYMTINEYMDERLDFWKSTHGALSKLEENYRAYNDWALSLAAYNSGSGAVNRLIKQTGIKDYWALSEKKHLKNESIQYVPKLLAISLIASNPRKFGLDISWKPGRVEWTRLAVDREADIRVLAEEAGVDRDDLIRMNRELHGYVTPSSGYMLKVRKSDAEAVEAVLRDREKTLVKSYLYRIRSGDTLSVLAKHYGVSVERILSRNPGIRPESLPVGGAISIPAVKDVAPYSAPAPEAPAKAENRDNPPSGECTAQKGDTLWSIAKRYGLTVEALAKANGMLISDTLKIGARLKIPRIMSNEQ